MSVPLYDTDVQKITDRTAKTTLADTDVLVVADSSGTLAPITKVNAKKTLGIDDAETALTAVKGTGWTDENLVDHEDRLDTLEGADTVEGSVAKTVKDEAENATFTPTVASGIESMTIKEAVNEVGAERAYLLQADDDLQALLTGGTVFISLDPSVTYSFNNISVPSYTRIIGNGAKITSPDTTHPIFILGYVIDVVFDNINLVGYTSAVNNLASISTDCAIQMTGATNVKITNCNLENFLGAAINCSKSSSAIGTDRIVITGNTFFNCYYGFVHFRNAEYGICSDNIFTQCRCAIWSQSGNWNFSGNVVVRCRSAFVSSLTLNDIATITTTNGQHGTVVGNTFNHCRSADANWETANYLIDGVDYQGLLFDGFGGCIPPTFTGNTCYYSGISYTNSASVTNFNPWVLTGCVFSTMTISCDVSGNLIIASYTSRGTVTKTNVLDEFNTTSFVIPTLLNSWENYHASYSQAGYMVDRFGFVHITGMLKSGTPGNQLPVFTLPVGARPSKNTFFPIVCSTGSGQCQINSTGEVWINIGSSVWTSIDGITFKANA